MSLFYFFRCHHSILYIYLWYCTSIWSWLWIRWISNGNIRRLDSRRLYWYLINLLSILIWNYLLPNRPQSFLDDLCSKIRIIYIVFLICVHVTWLDIFLCLFSSTSRLFLFLICDLWKTTSSWPLFALYSSFTLWWDVRKYISIIATKKHSKKKTFTSV